MASQGDGTALLDIRMLGPLAVVGEVPVALGGRRQRAVLALLVMQANATVALDRLVDQVWGERPPATATVTLQGYVYRLRKALDGLPLTIATRAPGYALEVESNAVDAHRFEGLLAQGSADLAAGRPEQAAPALRRALGLWRGPALADFTYEPFAEAEIARLEELRLAAQEQRVEADLALGAHGELVAELEVAVAEHPLREGFRGQLMRALHGSGRRAEALRVYGQGRDIMGEELGLDPGTALQRIESAILLQDPSVEPEPRAAPPGTRIVAVPVPLTSFVGRRRELEEVDALLDRSRLVTLTGPGGNGKTRLALRVAEGRVGPERRGAVAVVELAALTEPSFVALAVAAALGVREEPGQPVVDALVEGLGTRELLVLLDNCEHLVGAAASLMSTLLTACPGLRVLATSREALDLPGERAWPVPPLPVPPAGCTTLDEALDHDAALLFVERAIAAFGAFAPTDADAPALTSLCRRLDGVPLALELAAARMQVLTLQQVVDRLDDRFRLLTGGSRAVPARQRSLHAAVEWSFDLLDEAERALFSRLSVFAGSFSLDAVVAVCVRDGDGDERGALDLLSGLVQKSLVNRAEGVGGDARYRLLETLRHFAAEHLVEGEPRDRLRDRHATYLIASSEEAARGLRGPQRRAWLDRLGADHDDARAALEWLLEHGSTDDGLRLSAALWPFWDHRYEVDEGRTWLGRALDRPGGSTQHRLDAMAGAGHLAWTAEDLDAAVTVCEAGLALSAVSPGAGEARAQLALTLGEVLRHQEEDLVRAEALCQEAATLFGTAGNLRGEALAERVSTLLAWDRGELVLGTDLGRRCLELSRACGDLESSAGAQSMLAGIARDRGDVALATQLYEASLTDFEAIGEPWGTAQVVDKLAALAVAAGDHGRAGRLAVEALRLNHQLGNQRGIAESTLVLGEVALAEGDLDLAEARCTEALVRLRRLGFTPDIARALLGSAQVALERDDVDRAAALAEEALDPYRRTGNRRGAAPALALLAEVRARQGDRAATSALEDEAVALYLDAGDERGVAAVRAAAARRQDGVVIDLREATASGRRRSARR